jgi:hypothetical protein
MPRQRGLSAETVRLGAEGAGGARRGACMGAHPMHACMHAARRHTGRQAGGQAGGRAGRGYPPTGYAPCMPGTIPDGMPYAPPGMGTYMLPMLLAM